MPIWADLFKIVTYAFESDPLSKTEKDYITGAGVTQPEAIPNIRQDGSFWGGTRGVIRLRDSNDFIDLSSVTNRQSRLKEYERLRNVAEIEQVMTIIANEACVVGDTKISTPYYGERTIEWLTNNIEDNEPFLVYCWDFNKSDYTLGWASNPRFIKVEDTIKIALDNGTSFCCTLDHRILLRDERWIMAGQLEEGDELMPFYCLPATAHDDRKNPIKTNQFPRVFTFEHGWMHERHFIDYWKNGRLSEIDERTIKVAQSLVEGVPARKLPKACGHHRVDVLRWTEKAGFGRRELKGLGKHNDRRRVIGVFPNGKRPVFDLSVKEHKCFCTNSVVMHNCQKNDDDHIFDIQVKNKEIKEELSFLFNNRNMLNMDRRANSLVKKLCIQGDLFLELIINPDNPKDGILKALELPADSVYRIETTKGRVVEFQQSSEGPDYQSLTKNEVTKASEAELMQSTAIRFAPQQITHMKLGDDRKLFYPYGQSLIEPARGPAHQLRLMEDAMLVYRLTRSPERRVFYIDVGTLPSHKQEALVNRMKDQFRKKKVSTNKGGLNANSVEERWHSQSMDEDFWVPIRPQSNTRIETLPGACLALDSRIPLLDGTNDTLSKLIQRWNSGEEMWAYSCNPQTGKMVPGLITWAGITRRNAKVMKVTFDNGKSLICTPDHKFPVIGKEGKTQAKDLEIGDSLIPFRTRKEKIKTNTNEYTQIYDPCDRQWKFVHRIVANYEKFEKNTMVYNEKYANDDKRIIHHKDFNRFNNNASNLYFMNWRDHLELHQDAPNTPEQRKKISLGLKKYHENLTDTQRKERNKKLAKLSKKGTEKIQDLLANDKNFRDKFTKCQAKGWKTAAERRPELHRKRGLKISENNRLRFSNPKYKSKVFNKQTIRYPDSMFEIICEGFKEGIKRDELINEINSNKNVIKEYVDLNQHIVRKTVNLEKGITENHFKKLIKSRGYNGCQELRKHLLGSLTDRSKQNANQTKIYGKTTINFPKKIFSYFMHRLADEVKNIDVILNEIKNNKEFMQEWKDSNSHVKRKKVSLNDGIKRTHVSRMVKSYGYESLEHARKEAKLYNHTVVKIEYLDETQDVGTITIDGNEIYHNYHTFAVSNCNIITYNSNLGEIDDALYFRNKLFTALNFPKNYFSNEDPGATRITLSFQNVNFARMIEQIQMSFEDGMFQIAHRHLTLRGYPPELYEDLLITMTPPSAWKELSQAEVITNRINNANALKGSMLMSDYDIFTEFLKYPPSKAQEFIARNKIQQLEQLKIQVMAQNPQLLGVGTPGGGNELEMGSQPGSMNPMLTPGQPGQPPEQIPGQPPAQSPEQMTPPEQGEQPQAQPVPGTEQQPQTVALAEPEPEELKKYDLELQNYDSEQDQEEIDFSID